MTLYICTYIYDSEYRHAIAANATCILMCNTVAMDDYVDVKVQ